MVGGTSVSAGTISTKTTTTVAVMRLQSHHLVTPLKLHVYVIITMLDFVPQSLDSVATAHACTILRLPNRYTSPYQGQVQGYIREQSM